MWNLVIWLYNVLYIINMKIKFLFIYLFIILLLKNSGLDYIKLSLSFRYFVLNVNYVVYWNNILGEFGEYVKDSRYFLE